MKKKIISVLLSCFLFISSTVSSFANPLVAYSSHIFATVATVLTAAGVVHNSKSDLYKNVSRFFEVNDYSKVKLSFADVLLDAASGKVKVSSDFLDMIFNTYDEYYVDETTFHGWLGSLPIYKTYSSSVNYGSRYMLNPSNYSPGTAYYFSPSCRFMLVNAYQNQEFYLKFSYNDGTFSMVGSRRFLIDNNYGLFGVLSDGTISIYQNYGEILGRLRVGTDFDELILNDTFSTYDKSLLGDYSDGKVINVPSDLSDLVGKTSTDVLAENPSYGLPIGNSISVPVVDSPYIDATDESVPFVEGVIEGVLPEEGVGEGTETDEGVWGKVKDFVISLVVPADTFWTQAFEGVYAEFNNAFPMVNISNFKSLVVGGKPFPNIYITIFGTKCKVVDGDVINSIADWLKPFVAGFMMLCLMLYNYRKIYKLIRNTEPFGPIAPGSSEFRTGMSAPSMSVDNTYEIAQAQIRDVMFDIRNEFLSRKNK